MVVLSLDFILESPRELEIVCLNHTTQILLLDWFEIYPQHLGIFKCSIQVFLICSQAFLSQWISRLFAHFNYLGNPLSKESIWINRTHLSQMFKRRRVIEIQIWVLLELPKLSQYIAKLETNWRTTILACTLFNSPLRHELTLNMCFYWTYEIFKNK